MVGVAADAAATTTSGLPGSFTHFLQLRNRSLTACADSSSRMRRILVLAMVAVLAASAAEAALARVPVPARTAGAQFLELERGNGRAAIAKRGTVLVTVRAGRIRIVDLPGGGRPRPNCNKRPRRIRPSAVEVRGPNARCLVSSARGGPWQVIVEGRGIFASGRARGSLTLDGANTGYRGRFRIGDGSWRRWPIRAHTYGLLRR